MRKEYKYTILRIDNGYTMNFTVGTLECNKYYSNINELLNDIKKNVGR